MKQLKGINRLMNYVKHRKGLLFILVIMAVVTSVMELVPPQLVGKLVDVLSEGQMKKVILYVFLFGAVYVLSGIIKLIYSNLVMSFNYRIIEDVRKDLFSALLCRQYYVTDKEMTGDIITRATGDIEQITRVVAGPLNGFVGRILTFFFSLILLCCISPILVFLTIGISIILFFMSKNIGEKNKENGTKERGMIGSLSQKLSDVISNLVLIKSYQTEQIELNELQDKSRELINCRNELLRQMAKYWSCVEICNGVGFVLAFVISAFAVSAGRIPIGQIVVIYSYLQSSFSSMVSVSRYKTDIYNADAAMVRLFSVIPEEKFSLFAEDNAAVPKTDVNLVEVKDLSVHISGRDVISHVSFCLEKGKLSVLAGESGSGKTTILNALLGFVKEYSGQILINGQDYTDKPDLRRQLTRVSFQNAYLFQKTLEENIYYGSERGARMAITDGIDISRIRQAHPAETVLEAKNSGLSGGEQRKISFIRTLNKDVPMYIFDEPTAEMDAKSSAEIVKVLKLLSKEAVILVISHDEALISCSDNIISSVKVNQA